MTLLPKPLTALFTATLLLAGSLGLVGMVAGETERYDLGQLEVITGTVGDDNGARHRLQEEGDFVAVKFGGDSWFAVVYGTNETPNFIHMRSFQLRYLGGATITNERGRTVNDNQPIPIAHIAGQALPALVEFKDEGYDRPFFGAGNGLFDFRPIAGKRGTGLFNLNWAEPVQKAVDLRTAWTLDFDRENDVVIDHANQTAELTFALSAYDLPYVHVRDDTPTGEVLDEVTITFHLTVRAVQRTVDMPWYKVEVGNNEVRHSKRMDNRTLNGTAIESGMKYDHYINGWDYQVRNNNSRLMLTTYNVFATFIPGGVAKWMKSQFLDNHMPDATGVAEYETDYEIDQDTGNTSTYGARGDDAGRNDSGTNDSRPDDQGRVRYRADRQLTNRIQRVATNRLDFNDNWGRVARFQWVSDVESTVNGTTTTNESLTYQVHAMQQLQPFMYCHDPDRLQEIRDRDVVRGIVILGGYIYPAGDTIFHDPLFEVGTVLADLGDDLQKLLNQLGILQIVELVAVGGLAVVLVARSRRRIARLK